MSLSLNSPEARQEALRARLFRGEPLELSALAEEFGISADSVRRDLKALELQGFARCIRGGALPVARPAEATLARMDHGGARREKIAEAALPLIEDGMVLMLDGGTTVLALAQALPPLPRSLVVTPAPAVALATLAKGIPTVQIGGRLSPSGAIAVGHRAVEDVLDMAADLGFQGACGLEARFGLGADDPDERDVKRAMLGACHRTVVLTGANKLGQRARHRVADCDALSMLITDAGADLTAPFQDTGLEVHNV